MRLLLIITDFGSFNNFLAELAVSITKSNKNTLHVICSKHKVIDIEDKLIAENIKIKFHFVDIPRAINVLGQIKAAIKIRKLVKTIKPDIIHSHFTTATFPTIIFRVKKYPYWATIHGLGMNSSTGIKKIIFTIVETICFIRLNRIFVVNNEDYNLVKKRFSKKVTKYNCLGFGCDIDKFNPIKFTQVEKEKLDIELDIKEDATIIAFTGRYVHFKGFNLVIGSFKKLTEKHPNKFNLILIGGIDPIHHTGLNPSEEIFYKTSKDIKNIGFTTNVEKYLSITDVFLFPSKKEGLPTCILESLAMGIPVITFNARGNNEIVINNYNGVLIDSQNDNFAEVESILSAVEDLTNDSAKRFLFKENALSDRLNYSRQEFIKENLSYYSKFMNN
jgi:glycosyltransferase involved in cell wall biosynthesis